jgi:hypothetical protein
LADVRGVNSKNLTDILEATKPIAISCYDLLFRFLEKPLSFPALRQDVVLKAVHRILQDR